MKKYTKPEMTVVKLKSHTSLLVGSNEPVRSVYDEYSDEDQL